MTQEERRAAGGLWVPPGHFYSPLPDREELATRGAEIFEARPRQFAGIETNDEEQHHLIHEFRSYYGEEDLPEEQTPGRRYYANNEYFAYSDAFFLYCFLRRFRPARIVEVGSGFSSALMLDVDADILGGQIEYHFIDPYPERLLGLLTTEDQERVRVDTRPVQEVELEVFEALGPRDFLFIDSSHVSKTGSDLNDLLFRVLPALSVGVLVHFHDVPYPFEYPRQWVLEGRAWNEAYVVRAFLQYNRAFQLRFYPSYLVAKNKDLARQWMPKCVDPHVSSSLWLERVSEAL